MQILTVNYQSNNASEAFTRSLKETGFGVLTNHPIPGNLIHDCYQAWEKFFSDESKHDYHYIKPSQAGYAPFGTENAKESKTSDLKEFFQYYPHGPIPDALKNITQEMYRHLSSLAAELLQWIENNLPTDIASKLSMPLQDMIKDSENTMLRILHYPPLPKEMEEGAVRAAPHEDINLITIIPAASAQGLQVKDTKENWHEVTCESGNIVVNVGDMLQMCTEHYYQSTTHRVINPTDDTAKISRYSMPLFLHPRKTVKLSSTHSAESYLTERLREIGIY